MRRPQGADKLRLVAHCLEELPPQAVNDILEEGVWTFGGATLLRGFDNLSQDAFAFPVRLADRPLSRFSKDAMVETGF